MTDIQRVRWAARQVDAALDDSRVRAVPAAVAWLRLIREGLLAGDETTPVEEADSDTMVEASVQCPACGASVRAHVRRDRGIVHSLTTRGDVRCGARGGKADALPVTTDSSGVTCDACLATMPVFGKEGIR